jgi:diguanylate cyclase (GGDEF)-like protein/PAS domain S-box-containing protein
LRDDESRTASSGGFGSISCLPERDRGLSQLVNGLNEIIFLVNENREIIAASDLAARLLGVSLETEETSKIEYYLPKVYIDIIFARSKNGSTADPSLTFPVRGANGAEIVLEARFKWIVLPGGDVLTLACRDISRYLETVDSLTNKEDLYRTIFHESPLGFVHVNSDGILTDCNAAFLSIFGLERYEVVGVCLAEENNLKIYPKFKRAAMDAVIGMHSRHESQFQSADGSCEGWVRVSFSPVRSEKHIFFGAVGIVEDITEARRADEKVRFVSSHDALTGLLNRRAGEEVLVSLDNRDNLPIAIIYADLNCLKLANDAFGHLEGDLLLKSISGIIMESIGENGVACRWGGDEFIVILRNTDLDAVADIVRDMADKCDSWRGGGFVRPSMALGYSVKTYQERNIEDVMKDAEDAMYAQKLRDGRMTRGRVLEALEERLHNLMDSAVGNRCDRMIKWGEWVAEHVDFRGDLAALRLLFRYHDIGLLACSDEISQIGGKPSASRVMTPLQHMAVGYRIARSIAEVAYIADLILYHHEWWDGMGYPSQLSGEEIPYLSRLVSIFDSIEGMLCLHGEGDAPGFDDVLLSVESCAGRQFDPSLTRVVVNWLRDDPPEFVKNTEG